MTYKTLGLKGEIKPVVKWWIEWHQSVSYICYDSKRRDRYESSLAVLSRPSILSCPQDRGDPWPCLCIEWTHWADMEKEQEWCELGCSFIDCCGLSLMASFSDPRGGCHTQEMLALWSALSPYSHSAATHWAYWHYIAVNETKQWELQLNGHWYLLQVNGRSSYRWNSVPIFMSEINMLAWNQHNLATGIE